MNDFYDPYFYDLNIGPGSRVNEVYLAEAKYGGGPILELGCGTGNVLLPIARSGLQITGIDISEAMLNHLQAKLRAESADVHKRVTLVNEHIQSFSLTSVFQQIFMPNDVIGHLLNEDSLRNSLAKSYEHLTPRGRLVLDISFFDVRYLGRFSGDERELLRDRGLFSISDVESIQVWELTAYNQESGILTAVFRYEFLDAVGQIMNTCYRRLELYPRRPSEILFALESVGFRNIEVECMSKNGAKEGYLIRAIKP